MAAPANAGRTGKPAALKLVEGRGNGRDSGGRPVKQAPAFRRLPPAKPDDMSPFASELWDELISELSRLQLVKEIDGAALRIGCEAYARWREAVSMRHERGILAETSQGMGVAPWVRVEESASKEFRAWCAEFGLTPAAEAKLATGGGNAEEDDSPFAG